MVGKFKKFVDRVVGAGKRAYSTAKKVGKLTYGIVKGGAKYAGVAGDALTSAAPILSGIPEIGPELGVGAARLGSALSKGSKIGNSLVGKADMAYDKGQQLYDAIRGAAARGGMNFGSSDSSGMGTTPHNFDIRHESRSNKEMKLQQRAGPMNPAVGNMSAPAAPIDKPAESGSKIATGPGVGMSSDYAADTVAQGKRKREDENQAPSWKTMAERYDQVKKQKTH